MNSQLAWFVEQLKKIRSRSDVEWILEWHKKENENVRRALTILGQHGWYLHPEMVIAAVCELAEVLKSGNTCEAEQALSQYYRERINVIAEELKAKAPNRARILRSAFAAHCRGEYELSVPIFLIQAEGICQELIGEKLFGVKKNTPKTKRYVDKFLSEPILESLLHPLAVPMPILEPLKKRESSFEALNRHQVLHGWSVDYGTEINSLKALSLLHYISWLLGELRESGIDRKVGPKSVKVSATLRR